MCGKREDEGVVREREILMRMGKGYGDELKGGGCGGRNHGKWVEPKVIRGEGDVGRWGPGISGS